VVEPARDWRAAALAATLRDDLADDRLAPHAACEPRCSDAELAAGNVELVVRATLQAQALGYELRALWPGAPPAVRGSIVLTGTDRVAVAGRLRDQLHRLARTVVDESAADAAAIPLPGAGAVGVGALIVIALLASPLLIARRAWRAVRRSVIGVTALGAAAVAVVAVAPANPGGVLFAAAGLAWGSAIAVTVPIGFPPLVGLVRIEYAELWGALGAWSLLVVQRLVGLAVLYVPVGLLAWWASGELAVVAVPVAVLVVRQAIRIAVAVVAERLDRKLADPTADAAAWHAAVGAYWIGYLTRNGLPGGRDPARARADRARREGPDRDRRGER